jgi:hypothetical protein
VRSLNGLSVRRALDAFNAADVVPVINKMHPVYHAAAFERPDQGQSITDHAGQRCWTGEVLLVPWPCSAGLRRDPLEGAEGGRPRGCRGILP